MLKFIQEIALEAGRISVDGFVEMEDADVHFKGDRDLVTSVDKRVEDYLRGQISRKFPEHNIFGEEHGFEEHGSEYCWVVDPIDGTTSFVHGQPYFSNSIALQKNGKTVFGVVNVPRLGELYSAEAGKGATLNGRAIRVSQRDNLMSSVLATGFACIRDGREDNNLVYLNEILPKIRDIRRTGSAALDLCFVAAGRLEGYWEMNLQPYDYAAGNLIVTEAGGVVTDFSGGTDFSGNGIVATNGLITEGLMTFFK